MRALILGGTKFFGKGIARQLAFAGYEVGIFSRGNNHPKDLPIHTHIQGDRNSLEDLMNAARKGPWDVVIDNICYDRKQMTLGLEAFRSTKRYVFCSTVSVYRFIKEEPLPVPFRDEMVDFNYKPAQEDPNDIHWKYARGKLEAEKLIATQKEVPWTILRPPVVYGPYDPTDRGFWYVARLLSGGPILLPNGGKNTFRLIYSEDCAKAFVDVLKTDKTLNRPYLVAQKEVITLREFVEQSAKALNVKAEIVTAPAVTPPEYSGEFIGMDKFVPDISDAERDFGFTTTPFEQWVASSATWFKESWKGDLKALLKTRGQELEISRRSSLRG